jgi:hypothetical protein
MPDGSAYAGALMIRPTNLLVSVALALGAATSLGCGGGEKAETGDACDSDGACADARCVLGGSFPGGICTPACTADNDCPTGFSCISRSSGMCLMNCTASADCAAARDASWQCRDESLQQGGGNRMVCIGP